MTALILNLIVMNGNQELVELHCLFLAGGWRERCRMNLQDVMRRLNDRKMCHPPSTVKYQTRALESSSRDKQRAAGGAKRSQV